MGKTFKDSFSKREKDFRDSRSEKTRKIALSNNKTMKAKRHFKIYEDNDTSED